MANEFLELADLVSWMVDTGCGREHLKRFLVDALPAHRYLDAEVGDRSLDEIIDDLVFERVLAEEDGWIVVREWMPTTAAKMDEKKRKTTLEDFALLLKSDLWTVRFEDDPTILGYRIKLMRYNPWIERRTGLVVSYSHDVLEHLADKVIHTSADKMIEQMMIAINEEWKYPHCYREWYHQWVGCSGEPYHSFHDRIEEAFSNVSGLGQPVHCEMSDEEQTRYDAMVGHTKTSIEDLVRDLAMALLGKDVVFTESTPDEAGEWAANKRREAHDYPPVYNGGTIRAHTLEGVNSEISPDAVLNLWDDE